MAFDPMKVLGVWIVLMKWPETPPNFPPGPEPLPAIGSVELFTSKDPPELFRKLTRLHGPVVSFYKPGQFWTYVSDYRTARWLSRHPNLLERSTFSWPTLAMSRNGPHGIHMSNGWTWAQSRNITAPAMNRVVDTTAYGHLITSLMDGTLERIQSWSPTPTQVTGMFLPLAMNAAWTFATGTPFPKDSEVLSRLVARQVEYARLRASPQAKFPFPELLPDWSGYNRVIEYRDMVRTEYEADVEGSRCPKYLEPNLLDEFTKAHGSYWQWRQDAELQGIYTESLTQGAALISLATDWALLYLTKFPNVRKQLQQEINDSLSQRAAPVPLGPEDVDKMPWMNAFIDETLRLASPVPFSIGLMSNHSLTVKNYTLPRQTVITYGLYQMNMDNQTWDEPEKFRPERFLNATTGRYQPNEHLATFSFGTRRCIGRKMTRVTVFYIVTSLLKNFDLEPAEPDKLSLERTYEAALYVPIPISVIFKPRA